MTTVVTVISDTHSEKITATPAEQWEHFGAFGGQLLILAGDISTVWPEEAAYGTYCLYAMLAAIRPKYDEVIFVPGNHEYWSNHHMYETELRMKFICDDLNIHYLNNTSVNLFGVNYIGATMWSERRRDEHYLVEHTGDYCYIRGMTYNESQRRFYESVNAIRRLYVPDMENVVITHHAPLLGLYPNTRSNATQSPARQACYSTDLSSLIMKLSGTWIFGHTHLSVDFTYGPMRIFANQVGFTETSRYNPHARLYISTKVTFRPTSPLYRTDSYKEYLTYPDQPLGYPYSPISHTEFDFSGFESAVQYCQSHVPCCQC